MQMREFLSDDNRDKKIPCGRQGIAIHGGAASVNELQPERCDQTLVLKANPMNCYRSISTLKMIQMSRPAHFSGREKYGQN
jgi:hypothetical protein